MKTRRDGVFAAGGLAGRVIQDPASPSPLTPIEYQFSAYLGDLDFDGFDAYLSLVGAQGMLASALDLAFPFEPLWRLRLLRAFTALASAAVLAVAVVWVYQRLGGLVAGVVLLSLLTSAWLVIYGRNLMWSTWAFYLPLIAVMFYLQRGRPIARSEAFSFGGIVAASLFVKVFANGYDCATTVFVMMVVTLVHHVVPGGLGKTPLLRPCLRRWSCGCAGDPVVSGHSLRSDPIRDRAMVGRARAHRLQLRQPNLRRCGRLSRGFRGEPACRHARIRRPVFWRRLLRGRQLASRSRRNPP